jgi:glycosyltransferase involved in cell wall biosynthesis
MNIALCILTYNEVDCLKHIYPTIPQPGEDSGYDALYAIDGGSTDGSIEFYQSHNVNVIGQSRRGRGDAFLQAFDKIDADAYIFFSPDGNEDVNDIKKFRHYLETQNADIVIASRMMAGAKNEEDDNLFRWRKWANKSFNWLANRLFNQRAADITDSINGFRAITKKAADQLKLDAVDYTIEYQMTMRAFKHNLNIIEFPTIEGQRVHGETQASSIPTGLRFLKALWHEYCTRASTS